MVIAEPMFEPLVEPATAGRARLAEVAPRAPPAGLTAEGRSPGPGGPGGVLVAAGRWPGEAALRLRANGSTWTGLGHGEGLLAERMLRVEVTGRGAAGRGRVAELVSSPRRETLVARAADHDPAARAARAS